MSDSTRICSRCGLDNVTAACSRCTEEWENRRDVTTMTVQERADEFDSWGPILEIDWIKFHQRAEELVGRGVLTHEFARPDLLRHEILTGAVPSIDGILAKLSSHVQVFPIIVDKAEMN